MLAESRRHPGGPFCIERTGLLRYMARRSEAYFQVLKELFVRSLRFSNRKFRTTKLILSKGTFQCFADIPGIIRSLGFVKSRAEEGRAPGMASTEGLVPITRDFLSRFYDRYPFEALAPGIAAADSQLREENERMSKHYAEESGNDLILDLSFDSPHKIDENLWKNREQVEEILYLLEKRHWPSSLNGPQMPDKLYKLALELQSLLKFIEDYQYFSSEKIFSMILTYMPQDFRASLIKQQRDRSEKKRQAEVETLLNGGGSIQEKYNLLWKQQMERRKQLVMLGSASGVYKTLIRFLVGVPQVLLDFVQQINDHNGPMEEQRERYGPPLYQLTQLGLHIRIFLTLWWKTFNRDTTAQDSRLDLLEESVKLYSSELKRFLTFLREVFEHSPFLISAEEAGTNGGKTMVNDFKETVISTGKTHEVLLPVDSEGSYVAWEFKLTSGKDVGFSVEYISSNGAKMQMLPYQRYDSHQGNFYSPGVGSYKLVWDNSYSTFYRKTVRYKVDAIPPVADAQKLEDQN
ncbi:uncharacterized protein LOC9656263 [Selaginella moellendorffii]|nr:uncharacterized protein LOC9656263 [Selaginella moellendorffii]|eukprot:XP_002980642.2 uncharacterized protein LOC9656263 [Selaginella moellendorffii]